MRYRLVALVAVCLCALQAVAQGLYWESSTTVPKGKDEPITTKTYYMPGKMRIETDKLDQYMIIRMDQEKMYSVNGEDKSYWEMTFADMEKGMKRAHAELEKMQEQLKDLPKEQREMMEKMMGGKMPGKQSEASIEVKKTGETRTISGYACTKFGIFQGGKEEGVFWVTKDVRGFAEMRKDMEVYSKRMGSMDVQMARGMAEAMKKIDGFPMEMNMSGSVKTVVTSIAQRATPGSAFEVPAGFKKQAAPGLREKEE